jgi:hypothetical protein
MSWNRPSSAKYSWNVPSRQKRRVVVPLLDRVAAEAEQGGRVVGGERPQDQPLRPQHGDLRHGGSIAGD